MQQRLNRLPQKELRDLSSAKRDVIHGAAIAQDTLPVQHKYMRGCDGFVLIGDNVSGIDQDFWDTPRLEPPLPPVERIRFDSRQWTAVPPPHSISQATPE